MSPGEGYDTLERDIPNTYALYYSEQYSYKGICDENSNDVKLSSIPKGENAITVIHFNKDGYSQHCKDYKSYQTWLEQRNTARYVDIENHNQQIDGKNLLHCRRLLDMAMEIPVNNNLTVLRKNADYLLKIRKGQVPLQEIIDKAQEDIILLDDLYENSSLPDTVDDQFVEDLLLELRSLNKFKFYINKIF